MYQGAVGVKTGFTNLAGYCFVGAADTDCGRLISVVLGSGWPPKKMLKWKDSERLLDYGSDRYERVLLEISEYEDKIQVRKGDKEYVAVAGEKQEIDLPVCESDVIQTIVFKEHLLWAPVKTNKNIGWKRIYVNGKKVLEQTILTNENCSKKDFSESLQEILHGFYI